MAVKVLMRGAFLDPGENTISDIPFLRRIAARY